MSDNVDWQNTELPCVSVIVPVYNVERYFHQCMNSLMYQTLKNIEIILVDDGSPDNCSAMCDAYAEQDKRVKVVHQQNSGAGTARNTGMDIARGEYLYFMDGDDWLDLNAMNILYDRAKRTDAEVVVFSHNEYDNQTGKTSQRGKFGRKLCRSIFSISDVRGGLLDIVKPAVWNKFYLLSFVKEKNIRFQDLDSCNDVYFSLFSLIIAMRIICVNYPLITWRKNQDDGITSKRGESWRGLFAAFDKLTYDLTGRFESNDTIGFYQKYIKCCLYEYRFVPAGERDLFVRMAKERLPYKYFCDMSRLIAVENDVVRKFFRYTRAKLKGFISVLFPLQTKKGLS